MQNITEKRIRAPSMDAEKLLAVNKNFFAIGKDLTVASSEKPNLHA
jgi:hypothetical protein